MQTSLFSSALVDFYTSVLCQRGMYFFTEAKATLTVRHWIKKLFYMFRLKWSFRCVPQSPSFLQAFQGLSAKYFCLNFFMRRRDCLKLGLPFLPWKNPVKDFCRAQKVTAFVKNEWKVDEKAGETWVRICQRRLETESKAGKHAVLSGTLVFRQFKVL